jgi:hypothetical protein
MCKLAGGAVMIVMATMGTACGGGSQPAEEPQSGGGDICDFCAAVRDGCYEGVQGTVDDGTIEAGSDLEQGAKDGCASATDDCVAQHC